MGRKFWSKLASALRLPDFFNRAARNLRLTQSI
jgi:hypothetical protein